MRTVSRIVSVLFHPLLMPAVGLALLLYLPSVPVSYKKLDSLYFYPDEIKNIFFVVLVVLTVLAPGLSILIMKSTRMISSLELADRSERTAPFVLILFYLLLAFVYLRYQIPEYLQHPGLLSFSFGMFVSVLIAFVINISGIKISLHAVGSFGLSGGILSYNQTQLPFNPSDEFTNLPIIAILMVLAGLVCSFRMYAGAHTLKETLVGIAVGFFTMFFIVRMGLYF